MNSQEMELVLRDAEGNERALSLCPGAYVVGRDDDCDIQLFDDLVSRRHALLRIEGGRITIEDLGSRNGTYLDGVRITTTRVMSAGQRVSMGGHTLVPKPTTAIHPKTAAASANTPPVIPKDPLQRAVLQLGGTSAILSWSPQKLLSETDRLEDLLRPKIALVIELCEANQQKLANSIQAGVTELGQSLEKGGQWIGASDVADVASTLPGGVVSSLFSVFAASAGSNHVERAKQIKEQLEEEQAEYEMFTASLSKLRLPLETDYADVLLELCSWFKGEELDALVEISFQYRVVRLIADLRKAERAFRLEEAAQLLEELGCVDEAGKMRQRLLQRKEVTVDLNRLLTQIRSEGLSVPYKCTSCGGTLQIDGSKPEQEYQICGHCNAVVDVKKLERILGSLLS
jgi:pSer/pThr/pTyr-binding forkhead associated (FHA) protein